MFVTPLKINIISQCVIILDTPTILYMYVYIVPHPPASLETDTFTTGELETIQAEIDEEMRGYNFVFNRMPS